MSGARGARGAATEWSWSGLGPGGAAGAAGAAGARARSGHARPAGPSLAAPRAHGAHGPRTALSPRLSPACSATENFDGSRGRLDGKRKAWQGLARRVIAASLSAAFGLSAWPSGLFSRAFGRFLLSFLQQKSRQSGGGERLMRRSGQAGQAVRAGAASSARTCRGPGGAARRCPALPDVRRAAGAALRGSLSLTPPPRLPSIRVAATQLYISVSARVLR